MQTESTIDTRLVERTAKISLVRVVDFEKIAADHPDGTLTVEELQQAGDFVVVIDPNGKGAKQQRHAVPNAEAGGMWLDGFTACADLKKKGVRKPSEANGELARMTKAQLFDLAKKRGVDIDDGAKKAELVAALS